MCGVSDPYKTVRCVGCGQTPTVNPSSDKFVCKRCGDKGDFGVCTHPYAFKLLVQTLAGGGVNIELGFKKIPKPEPVIEPMTNYVGPPLVGMGDMMGLPPHEEPPRLLQVSSDFIEDLDTIKPNRFALDKIDQYNQYDDDIIAAVDSFCLLYTSPSPRD